MSISGTIASTLGQYNPLRYRGYVYDRETGLYYLQSRYYNPEIGRFINADSYAATGQGALGNNMFAYCNNNPVNMYDNTGNCPEWIKSVGQWLQNAYRDVCGFITKSKAAAEFLSSCGKVAFASGVALISGKATLDDIVSDITKADFFNNDPSRCIGANVFSFYNGTPVIIHSISGGSLSFDNTILLSSYDNCVSTVQHEWGHTVQSAVMTRPKWIGRMGMPSILSAAIYPQNPNYFSQPWERSADFFGGVTSHDYTWYANVLGSLWFVL